jgi:hypothetical protein
VRKPSSGLGKERLRAYVTRKYEGISNCVVCLPWRRVRCKTQSFSNKDSVVLKLSWKAKHILLLYIAILVATGSEPLHAEARLEAHYEATLAGIAIGTGQWVIDVGDTQYTATMIGKTSDLLRYISIGYIGGGQGSSTATGTFRGYGPFSSTYTGNITTSKKNSNVRLTIKNNDVKELKINPQQDHNPERVPITEIHRQGVVDPMSASILPSSSKNEPLSPRDCERSLPVFDGWLRFNLQLVFKRLDKVHTDKGYSGPVVVCAVYFSPVAGYIPSRTAIKYLVTLREMEIWLAPIAGTNILVPIRAEVPTPIGHAVLRATQFVSVPRSSGASSNGGHIQ